MKYQDKYLHFIAGMIAAAFVAVFLHMVVVTPLIVQVTFGIFGALVIGGAKELWDETKPNHTFDGWDAYWTAAGGLFCMLAYLAYKIL